MAVLEGWFDGEVEGGLCGGEMIGGGGRRGRGGVDGERWEKRVGWRWIGERKRREK